MVSNGLINHPSSKWFSMVSKFEKLWPSNGYPWFKWFDKPSAYQMVSNGFNGLINNMIGLMGRGVVR